jgi:hypothetical protein
MGFHAHPRTTTSSPLLCLPHGSTGVHMVTDASLPVIPQMIPQPTIVEHGPDPGSLTPVRHDRDCHAETSTVVRLNLDRRMAAHACSALRFFQFHRGTRKAAGGAGHVLRAHGEGKIDLLTRAAAGRHVEDQRAALKDPIADLWAQGLRRC